MIRLVTAELTRLRWRRAVLVLLAAAFVVPALIGVGTSWNSRPYSADEVARAEAQAMEQPGFAQEVRQCEQRPGRFGVDDAEQCRAQILGWWTGLYREPLDLRSELHNSGVGVASVLLVLLVLVGTTFAGADWNSGSMSNQLLFEPRRLRVWLAKALAVGATAAVVAAVVLGLYWTGLALVASARGIDAPPDVGGEIGWMIARCTFLAGLGAVGGYALTMLFRSTVFTLGAMFATSVVSTFFVAALPLGTDKERWLPPLNVAAVMQGKATYWREPPAECMTSDPGTWDAVMRRTCEGRAVLTVWDGLVFILVPAIVVVLLSLWAFRRRDVP
jgi:hypothetical protein